MNGNGVKTDPSSKGVFVIGFSGTRFGMSDAQKAGVFSVVESQVKFWHFMGYEVEAHHGDCVGADEEFHHIVRGLGVDRVVIHPPTVDEHRAFCEADVSAPPYPHLTRNGHIVRDSDIMVTAPPTEQEQVRGGTWSTTRLAREVRTLWRCVLPSGIQVPGPGVRDT